MWLSNRTNLFTEIIIIQNQPHNVDTALYFLLLCGIKLYKLEFTLKQEENLRKWTSICVRSNSEQNYSFEVHWNFACVEHPRNNNVANIFNVCILSESNMLLHALEEYNFHFLKCEIKILWNFNSSFTTKLVERYVYRNIINRSKVVYEIVKYTSLYFIYLTYMFLLAYKTIF